MRNTPFWWILIGMMVLLDFYFFQGFKVLCLPLAPRTRSILYIGYWVVSVSALALLLLLPVLQFQHQAKLLRTTLFALVAGLFFAKLLASLFFMVDDLRRGLQWISGRVFLQKSVGAENASEGITRSVFLSWAGTLVGTGLFGSLVYGFGNKYRYQVKKVKMSFENLPAAFRGLKIVHISDIHSGSFNDKKAVQHGVDKIMALDPDMILFTGDLVNNTADEMNDYIDVFSQLKAPMGVYSTLGNHDYGDYVNWDSQELKQANLERLKGVHATLGWRLLMNEHIVFERNDDRIALIGIENWSNKARFPKYGDMARAYDGAQQYAFKILMSHDPSHWDAQVLTEYKDVDLMLAGHTHGMQFGVEIPGFKWSPVQYVYRKWAGLYEEGNQKLYVNRGFGFLGYPGRVGVLPEITLIELT